ncbi:Helix-turn-helix [Chitinophaga sp. CF118]|uniref:helix-turn-helix domain-containing protein n=1 Tax=Chitinophaga sp. CF118 TaxID=1884367 RepID=UPI0008E01DD9|nr:helix-turn-helix transcriptional regulator [Chitinophaga sp. CF118]SFD83662.1 Helix-turn-helix [Chitinophaga sp. CF118]
MIFNDRVALAREKKGLTRVELEKLIGVSNNMIGKYERGEITPPLGVATKIAEVLDCSLDYLVGLTEENNEKSQDEIPGRLKPALAKFEQLSPADRTLIMSVMDAFIVKAKVQSIKE